MNQDGMDDRRKRLVQAMMTGGGASRLLGSRPMPLFGGLHSGAHSSLDLPQAALPQLSFDPYSAQAVQPAQAGGQLAPPTQDIRVADDTGAPTGGGTPPHIGDLSGSAVSLAPPPSNDGTRILYGSYGSAQPQSSLYDLVQQFIAPRRPAQRVV